jgi:hypothetical protein
MALVFKLKFAMVLGRGELIRLWPLLDIAPFAEAPGSLQR